MPENGDPRPDEMPAEVAARLLGGLGLELADLEDLGPAVRARALNSRATVLHRDLLRILDLDLLAFLDAVALSHLRTSFREPIPRATLDDLSDARGPQALQVSVKCN